MSQGLRWWVDTDDKRGVQDSVVSIKVDKVMDGFQKIIEDYRRKDSDRTDPCGTLGTENNERERREIWRAVI